MEQRRSRHIALNTLVVIAAFGLAAAMGLLRNIIISREFTIGSQLDAYYAAFKLPDLLFTIVAGGALATAFIPVFADFLTDGDRPGAWRLASAITNLVVIAVAALAGLAALSAPWLVRILLAPGFAPAAQAETATVMRIVLLSTLLFGISSVQSSVLHGFKHFLLPALAPALYPLGIIVGALWLAPTLGIMGLAWGALLGAFLHLAAKVPALVHFGFRWQPVLDLRSPAVHRVGWLMGPRILDLAVFQLTLILMTNLASRLATGSVSALEWGWDAMQLPETLIGTAFGIVAFPTMVELAARSDVGGLRHTLGETTRAVLALATPAAVALILLGRPVLSLLYQGGSFDDAAIDAIYVALRFFAIGLVAQTALELAARAFFAQQDTVTPLLVAAASGLTTILLGALLMRTMGHGGLALGNSLAVSAEVLALWLLLRRRWGSVEGRSTALTLGRVALASGLMALALWGVLTFTARQAWATLPTLALAGVTGGVTYVIACVLLKEHAVFYLPAALLGAATGLFAPPADTPLPAESEP